VLIINNAACGDVYSDAATLGPIVNCKFVTFVVANNSAVMQINPVGIPSPDWGSEILVTASQGNTINLCSGVRFRNAVAGSVARVSAVLSQPNDPVFTGGPLFAGTLSGGGGVTPPAGGGTFQRVTSLPVGAADGTLVEYTDATSGADWFLSFNATAGVWVCVGGAWLYSEVLTDETAGSVSAYVDLATVGPQITVPLAGDYLVRAGSQGWNTVNAGQNMHTALKVGAAAAVDADAYSNTGVGGALSAGFPSIGSSRSYRKTGLAAGTNLRLQYFTVSNTAHFLNRWLTVLPLNVH